MSNLKKYVSILAFIFCQVNVYSQACNAIQYVGFSAAVNCTAGTGYYNTGCQVWFDDGGGKRNYTCTMDGVFNAAPATGGNAWWTDNGACVDATAPVVPTTDAATSIGSTTATSGGDVSSDGGSAVTARGVVYNTAATPTLAHSVVSVGGTTGAFAANLTGLSVSTTYYVRAYATNAIGTTYGPEISFPTLAASAPTVTTSAASTIYCTTAKGGGNVTDNGGNAVTDRGVCWSLAANPTIADSKASDGSGNGVYTNVSLSGLSASTTYHIRAFATNGIGTSYGADLTFNTAACVAPSVAATTAASLVDCNSAESGGNVTSAGGAAITERGLAYHTSANPTTANSTLTNAGTTGSWSAEIGGLAASTTYYVRAYAINTYGTTYGAQISFTTTAGCGPVPTMSSTAATGIHCESMTANGLPTVLNGTISEKGFIFGTNNADVIAATVTSLGSASKVVNSQVGTLPLNPYALEMYPLIPSTTYYYKAYMINENGPGYGGVITQATGAACAVYYSCAAVDTWDTDASCGSPGDAPTGTSICYARHDWRHASYSPLTDHTLNDIAFGNFSSRLPYRYVVQNGAHLYQNAPFHVEGSQIIIQAGGTYGSNGAMDIAPGQANKLTHLENAGTLYLVGSMTIRVPITSTGIFCRSGSQINDVTTGGSINGIADANMDPYFPDNFNATPLQCVNTSTLPIELLSFKVEKNYDKATITWVTGSEIINDYFELCASVDGISWKKIAFLQGATNSTNVLNYSFVDLDLMGYTVKYYKLKQVDLDGKETYSKIISLNLAGINNSHFIAYDNDENIVANIDIIGDLTLNVYNVSGQNVFNSVFNNSEHSVIFIDKANFTSGLYFITINNGYSIISKKLWVK